MSPANDVGGSRRRETVVPTRAFLSEDPQTILRFALEGFHLFGTSALVTLVKVEGGGERAVGAQMAVRGDGSFYGFVSGGCTEAAVAAEALLAIECGQDRFLRLGEGSGILDIVLPCGGSVTLYIHVMSEADALLGALTALDQRKIISLRFDAKAQKVSLDPEAEATGWQDNCFLRLYRLTLRLLVFGRGLEAFTLARLATAAGYKMKAFEQVRTVDRELIDEHTAVALLYHDVEAELPVLGAALTRNPFYVGALGSRRTHALRCCALWELGFTMDDTNRIRAPIGLVPKARDAQTLALSVLAEIAAAWQ
ncbi:XdhC family protein [Rhizobium nepotum]|uniref:XdhC family protein n=1 Tax=Rhizobium nepotum TaxID=1035271 RepID=UPI00336A5D65